MKSLGYNDKEIEKIINNYVLSKYTDVDLYNKISDMFNYLSVFGYCN